MTPENTPSMPKGPSMSTLVKTTIAALIAAGAILVAFVLPAEYAIDPLGTGRLLGLTEIASPSVAADDVVPEGAAMVPTRTGPIGAYPGEFKLDVFDITLAPYEYIEYKYRLAQDATMLFSWTASSGVVHDFHGERLPGAEGAPEESFDKQERRQANGTYTAPFTGIHGWYGENVGGEPVTIRLTTAGFYTAATEIRSDRSRHPQTLRSVASLVMPAADQGRQNTP